MWAFLFCVEVCDEVCVVTNLDEFHLDHWVLDDLSYPLSRHAFDRLIPVAVCVLGGGVAGVDPYPSVAIGVDSLHSGRCDPQSFRSKRLLRRQYFAELIDGRRPIPATRDRDPIHSITVIRWSEATDPSPDFSVHDAYAHHDVLTRARVSPNVNLEIGTDSAPAAVLTEPPDEARVAPEPPRADRAGGWPVQRVGPSNRLPTPSAHVQSRQSHSAPAFPHRNTAHGISASV